MKTIGMIGGVSTEATLIYYKTINALVRARLGGYHSAEMRIHSVNFNDYNGAHETRDWPFIRAGFDAAVAKFQADTASGIAAKPASLDDFKAAFGAAAANCGSCHKAYRVKK